MSEPLKTPEQALDDLRQGLSDYLSGIPGIVATIMAKQATDSPVATDRRIPKGEEVFRDSQAIVLVLIQTVSQQLSQLRKTLDPQIEGLAALNSVRCLMEPAALGSWLCDPNTTRMERLKRHFSYRHNGHREQIRFLKRSGGSEAEIDQIETRIDDIETEAIRLGCVRSTNKQGRPKWIGCRFPAASGSIESELSLLPITTVYCPL